MKVESLLRRYRVPVFVFVTKMDLPGADRAALMADLRAHLSGACVDFTDPDPEQIALCDEAALEQYLDTGALPDATVRALIRSRKLFPCLFGSGLKLTGVDAFLAALERYAAPPEYPAEFGARVFKISEDAGTRLTWLKITGGVLGTETLDVAAVKHLATLPSREVLLAKLLGCMTNTVASFVRVVDAIRKQKNGEE